MNKNKTIPTDIISATWGEVKDIRYDVAILPWGAMEPHNYHLPYLTDCILSYEIAKDCAKSVMNHNVNCMVLPPVFMGSQNPGQWNKPFCVHTSTETQKAILSDIIRSLYGQGLRNLIIINGHGGNTFKPFVRDFARQYPDFKLATVDWFTVEPTSSYFEERPDEHAGEQETSVMLHYHPEWAKMEMAGDGFAQDYPLTSVDKKIGWMPRHWDKVSEDTGIGNPHKATTEKGKRYVEAVVDKVTQLIVELVNYK